MAAADLKAELTCSVCREIYTDPVTLPCGHNYCRVCIGRHWDWQEGIEEDPSCPECRKTYRRRLELNRNLRLRNIAESFLPTDPEQECSAIICTYCDFPVSAAKSCLHCEASLCDKHVRGHSRAAEHVLTDPTASFGHRKCSEHKKILEFYCHKDEAYICACCLVGEHNGHRVELLHDVSEKMKVKLKHILEKLSPEREEAEGQIQRLQERRREGAEKAAGETERVIALFRDIRERLEALEKRLLRDISKQAEALSLPFSNKIRQLEIKKDELSRKIRHIEELCNMADPLTVLQAREPDGAGFHGTEGGDDENRHTEDTNAPAVGDLDVGRISETLLTGLDQIVLGAKGQWFPGQEATDLVLDINTAGIFLAVSEDRKTTSLSQTDQGYPPSPERFQWSQVLSTGGFASGRHYWELEIKEGGCYWLGAAYPSIERKGIQSWIWNSNKSWGLYLGYNNVYSVTQDRKERNLSRTAQCSRIRVSLDYEAGHLSFYELSEPIRHLHTFSASFTEPLHAAFWVGWAYFREHCWVRIIS
ncbi:hypothetical protein XENTR_v10022814 [Xenopus tropicalis]|uniref:E3 ubiquitin-protein ligase TRIM7 n=1 Tax=Xenopus tropicalis TaxID=8364 RepID=A0A1B8Y1T4_XENTR|nr:E3 ubiquitin-protein ligase TRIM7 [Xenopus tropicalis]KAE8588926.1 hypothetical protein XENTR_v10022814 [Xenopus tropicalis]|eukprot:XP_004919733.1 PREDICTED: tripartite motif-containing protein 7-like [Xenopus tropicalis]